MTKKKTTQETPDCNFFWSMYPFKEGDFVKLYPKGCIPRYGIIRKPDDAEINFVEKVIGGKLTIENVKFFLKSRCNVQVVDDLTWRDILTACAKYQTSIRPPVGHMARKIYDILRTLPEMEALTSEQIVDSLCNLYPDTIGKNPPDASTIRKRHLPQLEPYGLTPTPHGYCIR